MARSKFLINNYMKDFKYYGLFLTEESKAELKTWLINSNYQLEILNSEREYLDHCTLLHKSQLVWDNSNLHDFLLHIVGEEFRIRVNGIGISDKALAFRVEIFPLKSANITPHITICTFNGGKPVDSNNITEWKDIEPIIIETKLEKR